MRRWATGCAVGAVLLASGTAHAQSATGGASVRIHRPVAIVKLRDLDFGRLIAGAAAGVVAVNPNTGARTARGGTILAGGTVETARFRISASPGTVVQITRNAPPVLSHSGGGATMNVVLLPLRGTTAIPSGTTGTFDIAIGGRLSVGANQLPGAYSGTFEINANYQ